MRPAPTANRGLALVMLAGTIDLRLPRDRVAGKAAA